MPKENPGMSPQQIAQKLISLANSAAGNQFEPSSPAENFARIQRLPLEDLRSSLQIADPEKILTPSSLNETLQDFRNNIARLFQMEGSKITLCVLASSLMGTQILKPEDFDDQQNPSPLYLNVLFSNAQDSQMNEAKPLSRPEEKTGLCSASGAPFYLPLLKFLPVEAIDAGSFIVDFPKKYPGTQKELNYADPAAPEIYFHYLEAQLNNCRKNLRQLLFDFKE